jgi:hypothetical protein
MSRWLRVLLGPLPATVLLLPLQLLCRRFAAR